ncbi:MAG: hypothetical protein QM692_18055 [Thermomicrobiales bacterium]
MPVFEFRELPTSTALDRRRQRTTVWVRAADSGPALMLGDIWCSPTTDTWHFTVGARNLQKQSGEGAASREETARALFAYRREQAEADVLAALATVNALRAVAGEHPLRVEGGDREPEPGAR